MASSSSSAKSSKRPRWNYNVFLSFEGEDTWEIFTSHLYEGLRKKGIVTFQNDRWLEHGISITKEYLKGIEESQIAVVIFSQNYASSSWCLDELVKIMECRCECGQMIIPVFYDVDRSHVRRQSEKFAAAFDKHESKYKYDVEGMQKVQLWRTFLTQAASLLGYDIRVGTESDFIGHIVDEISSQLYKDSLFCLHGVVGINTHLEKVTSLLKMEINDVEVVGIWGMQGVGKTTIAKAIFNALSHQFESSCFLMDIKENKCGMHSLQNILLSELLSRKANYVYDKDDGKHLIACRLHFKKVLVVLDGIDHKDHLDYLAGDLSWFGNGSRIIATTRDKHLIGMNAAYEVTTLGDHEAIQLFNQHAFKGEVPLKCFEKLRWEIVLHAKGLPLILKQWGSFLYKRNISEWRSVIDRIKNHSNSREQSQSLEDLDSFGCSSLENFPEIPMQETGIYVKSVGRRIESDFIGRIVDCSSQPVSSYSKEKHLVGIESRVTEVKSLLNVGLGGVYFVGIWGLGGSGKTTIARAIFDKISGQFEGSCFLANTRETSKKHGLRGREHLQMKLLSQILKQDSLNIESANEGVKMIRGMLSYKKVLTVLDDVDNDDQLEYLVGKRVWFGNGSRIITTTRNADLLQKHDELYCVPELATEEALELFSWHAFQQETPDKEFENLSICLVIYANGLPLTLEVLGSFLYKEGTNEWRIALDKLKDIGDGKVIKQLSLSLDGLSLKDKDIFLCIACFFRGKKKDDVITIMNSFGFESEIGVDILVTKSLLYISEGMVEMHDLIEQMGQQVARDTDQDQLQTRCRLWHYKDIGTVYSENLIPSTHTFPIASKKELMQKWKYDVFLSFRGEDTRNNFVAHLYKRMEDVGIHTFKDDVKLEKGKFISPELLKAIEE